MTHGPLTRWRRLVADGTIRHDPAQALAVEKLETLHRRIENWNQAPRGLLERLGFAKREPAPEGLYVYGDVGRGKSMLMDLFFTGAPLEPKRRVHFHAFMQEVHGALNAERKALKAGPARGDNDPIPPVAARIAEGARLLCFDEFQVLDVADAMILGRLFTEFFRRDVIVVATSNRAPRDLYAGGLNRQLFLPFIDLIEDRLDLLHLEGPVDHRLARLAGRPVYHAPLGPPAAAALDQAWDDLTDGATGGPVTLRVHERDLVLGPAARGVLRASFADLCARALGPADYLALARRFHTLILADVPFLSPDKRNEARRFVTLVDALYEASTRLIASAAAEPDMLYPAGDGSFEFQRTASRLMEMRSADWVGRQRIREDDDSVTG